MYQDATFPRLHAALRRLAPLRPAGRVTEITGPAVRVAHLPGARLGDRVSLAGGQSGEVVALAPGLATVLADTAPLGLAPGASAVLEGPATLAPHDSLIGRVIDPGGQALDGQVLLPGARSRPLTAAPPAPARRRAMGSRLATGLAVFDTLLPIVRGQRIGLFSGSGVGKSSLLGQLARGVEADVVVVALIGERGRELRTFLEEVLGPEGRARSVVVAATSDQPPRLRRNCGQAAMTVAEHFRDQGKHVLFLADSVTRLAEAHREVALAAGEPAAPDGFPASTPAMIAALAERAGPGADGQGDITAIFSVLVAGSDFDGPIADLLRGLLDGHVVLDRSIAERGRFPAIDVLRSVSRSLPAAAAPEENAAIVRSRQLLGAYDRAELMIQAGLYETGSDAQIDAAIAAWPKLDSFQSQSSPSVSESFAALEACLPKTPRTAPPAVADD